MCEDFGLGQEVSEDDSELEKEVSINADSSKEEEGNDEPLTIVSTDSVLSEKKVVNDNNELVSNTNTDKMEEDSFEGSSDQKVISKDESEETFSSETTENKEDDKSANKLLISPKKVHFSDEVLTNIFLS